MTGIANGDIRQGHGFTHWWTMFNPRQMLVHTQLSACHRRGPIDGAPVGDARIRAWCVPAVSAQPEHVHSLESRNADTLEPMFSNNNFHPKSTSGRELRHSLIWDEGKLGLVCGAGTRLGGSGRRPRGRSLPPMIGCATLVVGSGGRADRKEREERFRPMRSALAGGCWRAQSATDLSAIEDGAYDLVVTDPAVRRVCCTIPSSPTIFYVWLRLALKDRYPDLFSAEHTPKALEVVANRARHPDDPDAFYQRLLTSCWREANRILKPGGLLAFTFHHSEDAPWVAVLESLFDAGFYLEATYPIRGDETKGSGEFGSKKIEYDIIHVCRKRREAPTPVSWARMRRQVIADVRHLADTP